MKQRMKPVPLNTSPSPMKIKKANVKIILEDKHGNKEVIADHNMATNALSEYFVNCGWLNHDNAPQDNIVQEMLGGIMLFDDEIDEDADIIHVPSGLNMVANGAIGTTNSGAPYELGSCSAVETETGWQADGSYLQTYRWDENHGNGTIASLALTEKHMGYNGIGNPGGEAASSGSRLDISVYIGNMTQYSLGKTNYDDGGYNCFTAHVSIKNSEVYRIDTTDVQSRTITINKYRIPTQKINLKGTQLNPVLLDSNTITIGTSASDDMLITILYGMSNRGSEAYRLGNWYDAYDHFWVWNNATSAGSVWGDNYTQYLWDIDVVTGTITTYTIPNTSGDTLRGMLSPKFIGNKVFFIDGYYYNTYSRGSDPSKVYQFTITNGTISAITSFANSYGWSGQDYQSNNEQLGSGDKVLMIVNNGYVTCLDKAGVIYPTNVYISGQSIEKRFLTDCPQINYNNQYQSGGNATNCGIRLYRCVDYIATIYNLPSPVAKDATKTMTVVYTLTFDENPGTNA